MTPKRDLPPCLRSGAALDVVRLANRGDLSRDDLFTILSEWTFAPRCRRIATAPQTLIEPDSLDAVDVAYFDCGLLTDDEYSRILRAARVLRPDPVEGVIDMTHTFTRAMYVCRGCGTECAYPNRFVKCPVCGIKWG